MCVQDQIFQFFPIYPHNTPLISPIRSLNQFQIHEFKALIVNLPH